MMLGQESIAKEEIWAEDAEHLLPKITALILSEFRSTSKVSKTELEMFHQRNRKGQYANIVRFEAPAANTLENVTITKGIPQDVIHGRSIPVTYHHDRQSAVRSFIGGLSHCYNNLLMGIWGHASLIRMILDKKHRLQSCLSQMEDMIQNGAHLIHLLFGYIAERRASAKRLRLKQLMREMDAYNQICGRQVDLTAIETTMKDLDGIRNRIQLAASLAQVMTQMLTLIAIQRMGIEDDKLGSSKAKMHLDKIDGALERGRILIRNIRYYAVQVKPDIKSIDLNSLVKHLVNKVKHQCSDLSLTHDVSAALSSVSGDPQQISFVVHQLIDNAMQAVAQDGKIHIQVNTLNSEAPRERCGVHMSDDYAVISVTDNGKGMGTQTQSQIFEPFFTSTKGQGRTGLGLAAAVGIVKAHGGYIQVRSKPGEGSTLKIYLPKPNAA